MTRYPTPLYFDSSRSALVRFFSPKLAEVGIHPIEAKIPNVLTACPDSVSMANGKPCLFCARLDEGERETLTKARVVAQAWDLHKDRWCLYMAPPFVMDMVLQEVVDAGFSKDDLKRGTGPDVILQRQRSHILVMVMEETAGTPRGKGKCPPMEDYLRGLQSRSIWAKYSCPSEVPERV